MKRLFTLFVIACILGGNAWAGDVSFQKPIVEISTADLTAAPSLSQSGSWETVTLGSTNLYKTTVPGGSEKCYMFHQNIYWLWYTGSTDAPVNLGHQTWNGGVSYDSPQDKKDFDWTVKVTGNIDILSYKRKIDNSHTNDRYFLDQDKDETAWDYTRYGSHIYFNSSDANVMSGTITVTATNKDFEGKPYTCTYTIKINQDIKSTKWDFYSKSLTPTSAAVWGTETVGSESWHPYLVDVNSQRDLSSIISETAGLEFIAPKYTTPEDHFTFGYYDTAPTGTTAVDGRYVGLSNGATLVIPKTTWTSKGHATGKTHIRIKMGRHGGSGIRLTVTNAKDALGNAITIDPAGTYEIGGSVWWGDKGDNHQRGEYHFIVADQASDFTIKVEGANGSNVALLKLYTIEVYEYDANKIITENSVLGNSYQLLNNGGTVGVDGASGSYYLHYRGKAESTKIDEGTISTSGNINTNSLTYKGFNKLDASLDESGNNVYASPTHTYTSKIGDFGTFEMQIACYTHGVSTGGTTYQYCTDYASRRQSVGYMQSKSYPYTWDFTDIWDYKFIGDRMSAYYHGEGWYQQNGGLHLWAATDGMDEFGLRLALDAGHDVMYCGGSQLWYGHTIIPEAAGLAFTPVNYDNAYDYALSLSANGLTFAQENRDWWGWRVTVPSVPAKGAVYVRAKNIGSNDMRHVKFWIKDEGDAVNNKTPNATDFYDSEYSSTANHKILSVEGSSDEYIYAIYNNDATNAKDITLFFNEVEVQKIAVSTDLKTFNALGWTTESRDHDIDPSLTAEMNGRGIKTYAVTGVDYDKKKVTMTDISNAGLMHSASDGDKYACILRNTADEPLEVVNGGFYLFVPDMHDKQGSTVPTGEKTTDWNKKNYAPSMESSVMKAKVSHAYPANYPNDGDAASGTRIPWKEGNYTNFAFTYQYYQLNNGVRVDNIKRDGPQGFYRIASTGAYSVGNQGYLPLLTSEVNKDSSVSAGTRSYDLSFDDDESGEVTAIENIYTIDSHATAEKAIYYSLSGQKLSAKPAKGGIYICNGKKVIIK